MSSSLAWSWRAIICNAINSVAIKAMTPNTPRAIASGFTVLLTCPSTIEVTWNEYVVCLGRAAMISRSTAETPFAPSRSFSPY